MMYQQVRRQQMMRRQQWQCQDPGPRRTKSRRWPQPFSLTLSLFLILGLTAAAGASAQQNRPGVYLFENENFSGRNQPFYNDVPNLNGSFIGNDRASSVRVDRGCEVTLYTDTDYRGGSVSLREDRSSLRGTYAGNDSVSSLRVRCSGWDDQPAPPPPAPAPPPARSGGQRGVTVYPKDGYRGTPEKFYGDDDLLQNNPIGADMIRSIKVDPGCRITLYEHDRFAGRSTTIDRDTWSLGDTEIGNNQASSLRVSCGDPGGGQGQGDRRDDDDRDRDRGDRDRDGRDRGDRDRDWRDDRGGDEQRGVTVYRDEDFRGHSQTFSSDVPRMYGTGVGNDSVSSVRVERGCRVILWSDADFRGRSMEVTYDYHSLRNTPIGNDSVSSIQVDCRRR